MKVAIFGAGFVGLTCAVGLARAGHETTLIDIDAARIKQLQEGVCPFYEKDMQDHVTALHNFPEKFGLGRVTYTTDYRAIENTEVAYICVGTPKKDDTLDTSAVEVVVKQVEEACQPGYSIIVKSTLPVGTMRRLAGVLTRLKDINLMYAPEFLSEGRALYDFRNPARVVLGTASGEMDGKVQKPIYELLIGDAAGRIPFIVMDYESAELSKLAANAMLATRISFMNEIALIADKVGGDIDLIKRAIGADPRIGSDYLNAGIGWGGYCLPKDVDALIGLSHGAVSHGVLTGARYVNLAMPDYVLYQLTKHFNDRITLRSIKLAVWGCAFKAGTDDVRDSQAVKTIKQFLDRGAKVAVYDPLATLPFEHDNLMQVSTKEEALHDADALVILTDDVSFKIAQFNPTVAVLTMKQRVVVDGVNALLYSEDKWKELGFTYYGVGRK